MINSFNVNRNNTIHNRTSSQFRFLRLKKSAASGERINRSSGDTIGKARDPNFRAGPSDNLPYMKNVNQALSRLDFLERVLAEASYQGALDSAARMIGPTSINFLK